MVLMQAALTSYSHVELPCRMIRGSNKDLG